MNTPNKMEINKNAEELKVYMFTVQGGPVTLEVAEDFKAVMAYNDLDAINMVRKDYPAGVVISMKERARVEVRKIIDAVNLQPTVPQDLGATIAPPASKEKTAQDFVYGMMLVVDKYVVSKREQATMKRILSKIKLYEDTSVPTTKENVA